MFWKYDVKSHFNNFTIWALDVAEHVHNLTTEFSCMVETKNIYISGRSPDVIKLSSVLDFLELVVAESPDGSFNDPVRFQNGGIIMRG